MCTLDKPYLYLKKIDMMMRRSVGPIM